MNVIKRAVALCILIVFAVMNHKIFGIQQHSQPIHSIQESTAKLLLILGTSVVEGLATAYCVNTKVTPIVKTKK